MTVTIADALRAIEELPSAPRDLLCPTCPSRTAIDRLTMHRHTPSRIEASDAGAIRWWRCDDCRTERALDSVATASAPSEVA